MRLALISDVHGNLVALEAVLQRIDQLGVDLTVCLGDVATLGPRPGEVIDLLASRACPLVLGNHDEFLLDPATVTAYTDNPVIVASIDWCRAALSAAQLAYLETARPTLEPAGAELLLFHGSPASNTTDLLATTPDADLDRHLGGRQTPVMAGGHTHLPLLRRHRGVLLVNPGSVGMPFEASARNGQPTVLGHAEFAVVDLVATGPAVTHHRLALDRRALHREAAACGCPLAPMLVAAYR